MDNTQKRPLIMITNDDGYQAQGIRVLADLMRRLGDVVVVAPDSARSGAGCGITPTRPVSLKLLEEGDGVKVFACSGSPVDCVKVGYEHAVPRRPDLLVSGINHGDNASVSLHYSGTIGAVMEGCMKGIPSIGYSLRTLKHQCDFAPYSETIVRVAEHVLANGLPTDVCLNVNFPEVGRLAGVRVCRMARGRWSAEWVDAHHPHGQQQYWLTGRFTNLEPENADTDYWALDHDLAAITPLQLDLTAYSAMGGLKELEK